MLTIRHRHKKSEDFKPYPQNSDFVREIYEHWLNQCHFKVRSAVEYHCFMNWDQIKQSKSDNVIYFFIKGSGKFKIFPTKNFNKFNSGDLLILPQGNIHTIIPFEECDLIVIHFDATLYGGLNLLHISEFPSLIKNFNQTVGELVFQEFVKDYTLKPIAYQISLDNHLTRIMLNILKFHGKELTNQKKTINYRKLPRLYPVIQFIENNYSNPNIECRQLAQLIHVSEVYLRKLFKETLGLSPVSYLQRTRIDIACGLLKDSKMSIDDISENCGFQNKTFFYRVFKKWVGNTPLNYAQGVEF